MARFLVCQSIHFSSMSFKYQDVVLLLRRMADGDISALDAIYKAYQRQIFDAVRKKLHDNRSAAENVAHQTFETLIHDPNGYGPRKGPFIARLQGVAHFKVNDYFLSLRKHVTTAVMASEELTADEVREIFRRHRVSRNPALI